jgi:uncharacterized repeat protein (TIGR03803 family)
MNFTPCPFRRVACIISQALLIILLLVVAPDFAQATSFKVLHQFKGAPSDGSQSVANLLIDAGYLYGTTRFGGAADNGTVFRLSPAGAMTLLYSFCVQPCTGDGYQPVAGLIRDPAGNLYGTTKFGPYPQDNGTVFRLSPIGQGKYQETILYGFTAPTGGYNLASGVIRDAHGNLYGTTYAADDVSDTGTVYELTPTASGPWTLTTLYSFLLTGGGAPGGPLAGVIMDGHGNLYATTNTGGTGEFGIAFMLTRGLTVPWNLSTLFSFDDGTYGGYPEGNLIMDAKGNVYGTNSAGGKEGGVVYKLTRSPITPWVPTALYSFCQATGCLDGRQPRAGVVMDGQGNLYGTTYFGGSGNGLSGVPCTTCTANGIVYKIDTLGNETVLYNFTGKGDGANPSASLAIDAEGNLYGTTYAGGTSTCGCGTIFKVVP